MEIKAINHELIRKKYELLSRNNLDREGTIEQAIVEESGSLAFYQIKGISNFWEREQKIHYDSILTDVLSGLHRIQTTFVFSLIGSKTSINVYIGINEQMKETLESSLKAAYPYISLIETPFQEMKTMTERRSHYGGTFTGYPTNKTHGESEMFQIERLCTGLFGDEWAYIVVAKGIHSLMVERTYERLLDEMEHVSETLKVSKSGGQFGDDSWEITRFLNQRYMERLEIMEQKLDAGRMKGMWRMNGYFISSSKETVQKLRNLIISTYSGELSKPERVRALNVTQINQITPSFSLISSELNSQDLNAHPIGQWIRIGHDIPIQSFKYRYQTVLSSDDLATYCQIPRKEMPGYYINPYVEFEVADRRNKGDFIIGNIINGSEKLDKNLYSIPVEDLNRHGLIVGITGGGKSNTSRSLLMTLWNEHRTPFLVIESAKREYWELANIKGFENDLLVFTLGAEDKHSVPYRINPFEKIGDVPLQTHIDYLLATFKASFELYPPMPFVLETSVYRIYEDLGWDILKNENTIGINRYPTLDDLYNKIDEIVDEFGYDSKLKSDITAALKARIHSLRVGGKGAMMNTPKSVSMELLLSRPVVMELEDIGDDDVKAFIMGILLVQLFEYRKQKLKEENVSKKPFDHLIVIEEAHRLLANVSSGGEGANPRAKAVEFFTNLLAEIRSYGQGFLIADQVPTKLAPDTLKNTNLKIVHRIVMKEDRELIGQSMNMNEEQINYISTLQRGYAAVYAEGDARPKLVKMPLVDEIRGEDRKYRDDVIREMQELIKEKVLNWDQKKDIMERNCFLCKEKCLHQSMREKINEYFIRENLHLIIKRKLSTDEDPVSIFEKLFHFLQEKVEIPELSPEEKICSLNELLLISQISEAKKRKIVISYMEHYQQKSHGD
ncbi:ATP-binding protein [Peribacillus frigoritolerans]|uniref:ATP-binding protein n=1 Tax=Peribacillus frigoritolerans TaxID=450367 RepID=UPI002E1D62E6|nr:ATP-binding protein [Peribacillus frigoritolerans]